MLLEKQVRYSNIAIKRNDVPHKATSLCRVHWGHCRLCVVTVHSVWWSLAKINLFVPNTNLRNQKHWNTHNCCSNASEPQQWLYFSFHDWRLLYKTRFDMLELVFVSLNRFQQDKTRSSNESGHCSMHGPLARYVKLWVAHAPGLPGTCRNR